MRADDKNITVFNNQVGSVEALFGADADTAIAVKPNICTLLTVKYDWHWRKY